MEQYISGADQSGAICAKNAGLYLIDLFGLNDS